MNNKNLKLNIPKLKYPKIRIPTLRLGYRILLYIATIIFAALSSFRGENMLMIKAMNGMTGIVACCIVLITGFHEIRLSAQMKKEILE